MVAQQLLELPVKVRVLARQPEDTARARRELTSPQYGAAAKRSGDNNRVSGWPTGRRK